MVTPHPVLVTDVPGLDTILGGGLAQGNLVFVVGALGAGKTILANQILFHHARGGGVACSSAPIRKGMKN